MAKLFDGRRRRKRQQASLEQAMRDLSSAFRAHAGRSGHDLEVTPESARGLDEVVAALLAEDTRPANVHGIIRGASAYLGEVVTGAGKAAWSLAPGTERTILAFYPDGEPSINVVAAVGLRCRSDRPETIADFLDRCLRGYDQPPEDEEREDPPEPGQLGPQTT